jgi:glycosyltransferase involved in cell wall biosynthesis
MRVLHLAPLWFPVWQDAAGGIETFLTGLIAAQERQGCRTTLLASGDSRTAARLIPVVPRNLYAERAGVYEYVYYEQHQLLLALESMKESEVMHSHIGWAAYVLSGVPGLRGRVLHTHHNPVSGEMEWFVRQHPDTWFSTVSTFQARRLREHGATRCRVIPNSIDVGAFPFQPRGGEDLFFLGRMEKDKGPDLAVQAARALGRRLVLAGPMVEEDFFARTVEPFLNERIRYVGVVNHRQKTELLGQAGCVLMPSRCEEGFGMVSIEAMACGTPVVALADGGALPEIIESGVTGYVTVEEDGLKDLVPRALELDRTQIRARVADRFDLSIVAAEYGKLYREMLATSLESKTGWRGEGSASHPE